MFLCEFGNLSILKWERDDLKGACMSSSCEVPLCSWAAHVNGRAEAVQGPAPQAHDVVSRGVGHTWRGNSAQGMCHSTRISWCFRLLGALVGHRFSIIVFYLGATGATNTMEGIWMSVLCILHCVCKAGIWCVCSIGCLSSYLHTVQT